MEEVCVVCEVKQKPTNGRRKKGKKKSDKVRRFIKESDERTMADVHSDQASLVCLIGEVRTR